MTKRFRQFLAVPVVLALLAGGCGGFSSAQYTRSLNSSVQAAAPTAYRISTGNGYIRVSKSTSGKVEIAADVALQTPERRDAFKVIAEEQAGVFVIEPVWPEGKQLSSERCAFTIALPEATDLKLATSNGEITFGGFAGPANASTSNGKIIVLSHDGPVTLKTSNGSVKAEGLTGTADAATSNGSITLAFTGASTGPVQAKTSNGSITLDLPANFAGTLTLQTSNGKVSADCPGASSTEIRKSSGKVTFKDAGGESSAQTSNGSINIRQTSK